MPHRRFEGRVVRLQPPYLADHAADDLSQFGKRERLQRCCIRQRHANGKSHHRPRRNHLARESAPVTASNVWQGGPNTADQAALNSPGVEGEWPCTDIMDIHRPDDLVDVANLGLTLAEAKRLLAGVQREIVAAQARNHAVRRPDCSRCGSVCRVKKLWGAAGEELASSPVMQLSESPSHDPS